MRNVSGSRIKQLQKAAVRIIIIRTAASYSLSLVPVHAIINNIGWSGYGIHVGTISFGTLTDRNCNAAKGGKSK